MLVMISQPMHGKTKKQILKEREKLVEQLTAEGHEVLDTVVDIDKNVSPIYYLGEAIKRMSKAEAVVFMPGWEKARGCTIEYAVATAYGKFIKEVK